MNLKLLTLGIPRRRGFQATNVASMSKLSLCIAADDIVVEDLRHPIRLLLF